MATDKKKVSVYLDEELKIDSDKLAKFEKRSLSNLIEVLLHKAIEEAKHEGRL